MSGWGAHYKAPSILHEVDNPMGNTTVSKPIEGGASVADLTDEAVEQLMRGAPESYSEPGEDPEPIDSTMVADPITDLPDDLVMLTNIRHSEEEVFIPNPDTKMWSGEKVAFHDYRLVTTREKADLVKKACPYVYEEDMNLPADSWAVHPESNFRTTNPRAFSEYARQYAENR